MPGRGARPNKLKAFKTACELLDMIVEQARALHGPWPAAMTVFIFDDTYEWSAH